MRARRVVVLVPRREIIKTKCVFRWLPATINLIQIARASSPNLRAFRHNAVENFYGTRFLFTNTFVVDKRDIGWRRSVFVFKCFFICVILYQHKYRETSPLFIFECFTNKIRGVAHHISRNNHKINRSQLGRCQSKTKRHIFHATSYKVGFQFSTRQFLNFSICSFATYEKSFDSTVHNTTPKNK